MLPRLVVLSLLLIALSPLAAASHAPPEPAFHEQLAASKRFDLVLRHTHALNTHYEGSKEEGDSVSRSLKEESFTLALRSSHVAAGHMQRATYTEVPTYEAAVEPTREMSYSQDSRRFTGFYYDSGPDETQEYLTACSGAATLHGKKDGLLSVLIAELTPDGKHLKIVSGGGIDLFSPWQEHGRCHEQYRRNGYSESRDYGFFPYVVGTALVEAFTEERRFFEVLVPLDDGHETLSATKTWAMPGNDGVAERFCGHSFFNRLVSGKCTISSQVEVEIHVDRCGLAEKSYLHHLKEVENAQPIDPAAPEPWVLAWGEDMHRRVIDVLQDARGILLAGCGDLPVDPFLALTSAQLEYRDALLRIHREKGLTTRGIQEVLGAERSLQLLGHEDYETALHELKTKPPRDATLIAEVRSPVSLHAWSEDGKHVGWNKTTNRPDIQIEGANYTGAPNGYQKITLPAGFYKIEVEELGEGPYLLDVSWNGTGNTGRDEVLASALPGRTTNLHYGFDRTDENGKLLLDRSLPTRIPTP
ncbi:MAG TPA: hypothetical protein VNZ52_06245, partial [Candidatus Thermoplasmatota archaeon]|nr:hypothetical protein [Candidatus Thermoplasmatota archaeon]